MEKNKKPLSFKDFIAVDYTQHPEEKDPTGHLAKRARDRKNGRIDESFVVYNVKTTSVKKRFKTLAAAKREAEKLGSEYKTASDTFWNDNIKKLDENYGLHKQYYSLSKAQLKVKLSKLLSQQTDLIRKAPNSEERDVIDQKIETVRELLKVRKEGLEEKKLTPAELKKREEIAKAIERENPDMPMDKKMAIATATAKRVAEEVIVESIAAFADKVVDELNKRVKDQFDIDANIFNKIPGMSMWRRGDGSKYKEPSSIVHAREANWLRQNRPEKVKKAPAMKDNYSLNDWAWKQIKSMSGVKQGPKVKGEHGSDSYRETIQIGNYLFIKNDITISYATKSILKNLEVWSSSVSEGYIPPEHIKHISRQDKDKLSALAKMMAKEKEAQRKKLKKEDASDNEEGSDSLVKKYKSETPGEVDEALTLSQRLKAKQNFRRNKAKIAIGRKKAEKRFATPEKLEKRARKAARKKVEKIILKQKDKDELSYGQRQDLEKKVDKKVALINRLTKKLLPQVRRAEKEKKLAKRGDNK